MLTLCSVSTKLALAVVMLALAVLLLLQFTAAAAALQALCAVNISFRLRLYTQYTLMTSMLLGYVYTYLR
jgi:hypothetical protein